MCKDNEFFNNFYYLCNELCIIVNTIFYDDKKILLLHHFADNIACILQLQYDEICT